MARNAKPVLDVISMGGVCLFLECLEILFAGCMRPISTDATSYPALLASLLMRATPQNKSIRSQAGATANFVLMTKISR